ncbi:MULTISPECIES: SdpI family protein [unclassified Curtobacterium]|uniref:SdpI family protein n=1 Tax=unclassified Curtobacterium TaxID=257496 RepID=UPI00091E03F2|nr:MULTISPECIES: SdpI family protein [unclassified Curtobacterium]WIB00639.1 SdpI family protein [Curtobacterium sp. MCBA15_012]
MELSGLALAFSGVVVGVVAELAARGVLGPNGAAGIRIRSVMKSDGTWRAGHRAARLWLDGAGLCFVGGGLLNAFATKAVADAAVLIGMVAGLALVVAGSVIASRAAQRCDER